MGDKPYFIPWWVVMGLMAFMLLWGVIIGLLVGS